MKLLREFNALSYDARVIKEEKTRTGKVTLKGILQKADTLNQNARVYPRAILEREISNYQKFIRERRSTGELDHPDCVPAGTEIFTAAGWRPIEDSRVGDLVATINVATSEIEFQETTAVVHTPNTGGKLIRAWNARTIDMSMTSRHRVLLWDRYGQPYFMTAAELLDASVRRDSGLSHSGLRRSGVWVGEEPAQITVAGHAVDTQLWAAFLGIYLAEGFATGTRSERATTPGAMNVTICQRVGKRKEEAMLADGRRSIRTKDAIRGLLDQLPWNYAENDVGFSITDVALYDELFSLGNSHTKHVPGYVKRWSPALLTTLLDWMLLGDGRNRYGRQPGSTIQELATTSDRLADDCCDIMLKLGMGATVHTYSQVDRPAPDHGTTGRMILAADSAPLHIVYAHQSTGISFDLRFMNVEEVEYDGDVHCVTVPNGTWLMRQNGKACWTGNSSVINLKNVSHLITEAYMDEQGVVYGTIELLDTPSGMIAQQLVEAGVTLGISSRGVGSTKKQGDTDVVQDDFALITLDLVSEPSTPNAFLIREGREVTQAELKQAFTKEDRIYRAANDLVRWARERS